MNIYLIRPNYKTHLITPILGIGYISSYLKSQGYNTKIIDGVNEGLENSKIAEIIPEGSIVGISVLSAYFTEAKELCSMLKKKSCTVIMGGPHAICLPVHTLENTDCDYIITGEGELVFSKLLAEFKNNNPYPQIKGLYHKNSSEITYPDFIEDLDSIPFPDWEQMDPNKIKKAPHGGIVKAFPVGVIVSTRGCPYSCTFCASPTIWHKKIRFRSPKNVVDEIEYLIKNFGVKEIHFEDDNLTLKRSHVEGICNEILKRGLKFSWATPNGIRADKIDLEILTLMKKSGCYAVAFGIESANSQILKNVKKEESIDSITKAVNIAHSLNLITQGFFIFGLPGESTETIEETINYAKTLPLDKAQFLILDILPGSEIWNNYKDVIPSDTLQYKSFSDCSFSICSLSPRELNSAQSKAFRKFFFNPSRLIKVVSMIRISQFRFVIDRFKIFFVK